MTNLKTLWDGTKNYIYKHYGQESGKMIVHAGVITWITSSASQVFAIALNKKVPEDQKKFLIPQEIADGALNVLAFYLMTNSMKNISSKLISSGKWSTKNIRTFVHKNAPELESKMGDLSTNLGEKFKDNDEFHKCYDQFKGGADMIAACVGSVVSCNAITPFLRNSIGARQQKQSIEREKIIQKQTLYPNYSKNPKVGLKV